MKEVLAVVVTYNRKNLLKECLCKLVSINNPLCDILVVDNCSTDGTKELIDPILNENGILYYNTGKNLGGAGGFNIGLRKGVELGYKYLWIMDDDTYVLPDALDHLLELARILNDEFGWLSSVALWKDNSICSMNIQKRTIREKVTNFDGEKIPAVMATFVSFFIKAETVVKYGLPIKEFFIWSDDFEYSRRISKFEPCYVVGTSKVIHYMNSNNKVGIEQESKDRLWRYNYLYRNEVYVYRREGCRGWIYLWERVVLHTLRILFKAKDEKKNKIFTVWRAFVSGYTFNPPIEYIG